MFSARHKAQATAPRFDATPAAVSVTGTKVTGRLSPADRFLAAVAAGPLTPAERAAYRSQLAQVAAQDEAKRSASSPQMPLDMAA